MDVKCSFSSLLGGSCSYDPRDRSRSTEVIPFLNCKRDIAGHKSSMSITDVETEIELILGRVSTSFSSELNLSELTICPRHRSSLGIGWRRGSNLCRVPPPISKHGGQAQKNAKAERGLGKSACYYLDTCGSPVIKCLCFFVVFFFFFFFSSATKWKNCAIVPRGHWALTTMTTNCDPMRCSHADHACYLDDD